ncbi:MAG: hypothetical protein GY859_15535 [Desulfobacterales bacterium]|nr:hypothetical protein [Desulfobacterales bacterium]
MNYKMSFALLMGLQLGMVFLNIPPALDALLDLYSVSYTRISWFCPLNSPRGREIRPNRSP